jgi:uncharacterized protein YqeY
METKMTDTEIIKKLKSDLITYMKAQDIEKLNVIRSIINEINIRYMKNIKITNEEVLKVLRSEIKKRKESIESFEKGGRQDLVEKEQNEVKVIEQYLPTEISDEELFNKVKAVIDAAQDKSFGVIMKSAILAINGATDGKRVSAAVKKALESK